MITQREYVVQFPLEVVDRLFDLLVRNERVYQRYRRDNPGHMCEFRIGLEAVRTRNREVRRLLTNSMEPEDIRAAFQRARRRR